jgi:hypothetical protein
MHPAKDQRPTLNQAMRVMSDADANHFAKVGLWSLYFVTLNFVLCYVEL